MNLNSQPAKFAFWSFIISLGLLSLFYWQLCQRYLEFHRRLPGQHFFSISGEAAPLVETNIEPAVAKRHHEWWLNRRYTPEWDGAGLNLLASEKLFSEAFPGYPDEMRRDLKLWQIYFRYPFDGDVWLPSVVDSQEFQVHNSWLGCREIFRRYGADLIVFGNSETFLGVVPKIISDRLPKGEKRVLLCGRNALMLDSIDRFTRSLIAINPRPDKKPVVLLGYAQTWAYGITYQANHDRDSQIRDLNHFDRLENPLYGFLGFKFKEVFPSPLWQTLLPLRFADLREGKNYLLTEIENPVETYSFGVSFDRRQIGDLPALVKKIRPYYAQQEATYEPQCRTLNRPTAVFESAITSLKEFSRQVLIYRTPVTEFEERRAGGCLQSYIDELLQSQTGTVSFLPSKRTDFDLDWADYVKPGENKNLVWLDLNHVNFRGAQKVSSHLARWVSEKVNEK